MKMVEK